MKISILIFSALLFLSTSCCLFQTCEGCTDPKACNYDSDAENDDGSCNYGCLAVNQPPNNNGTECTGNDNIFNDILSQVNINLYDQQFGSPYQNKVISLLHIRQDRFKSCVNGYWKFNGHVENILNFKNNTSSIISFGYHITQMTPSGITKQYQNVINQLLPGQSYEINTGNSTFYNLYSASLYVNISGIVYE